MEETAEIKFIFSPKGDNHVDGTVYITTTIEGEKNTSQVLFRKYGQLQDADIERAKALTSHLTSNLENIEIHPVLTAQLIIAAMNANLVFHRDKKFDNPDANFHTGFFRINTLITTFSRLLSEETDEFKEARQFKHEPLQGLWYKHVEETSISGMTKNILNETKKGNWIKQSLIDEFGPLDSSEEFGKHRIDFLAKQYSEGALNRRYDRKAMSGEWLIFQKTEEGTLFLTLASHQENDERIMARITGN